MEVSEIQDDRALDNFFPDFDKERMERKQKLAAAFRIFGKLGLDEGITGHMSVRDPENPHNFWLNPFGKSYNQMKASDLILSDINGDIIYGRGKRLNKAAFYIHHHIYSRRLDVNAIVHAHTTYGKIWSTYAKPIQPLTQASCAFYKDHSVYKDYHGVVLDNTEGVSIAKALGNNKAVILKNHGLITVSDTIDAAAWWMISLEKCCHAQVMINSIGKKPSLIKHKVALETRDKLLGSSKAGSFNFQPLWQDIILSNPELLN